MNTSSWCHFLRKTGLITMSLWIVTVSYPITAQAAPGRQPNIIMILADDLGWMDCGAYGSRYYQTPHIDTLARRGMTFTNAYAASPLCSPTRASIMTGQYPARTRITTPACHLPPLPPDRPMLGEKADARHAVVTPESARFLPLEQYTLGEAFRDAGYHTGFIGKWHLGKDPKYWPGQQGFGVDLGVPNPGPPSYFAPYHMEHYSDAPRGEYITDRITDEAIRYIDQHRDEPFMLCWWHLAVHAPFQAQEELAAHYRDKTDPRGKQSCPIMAGMIESMDIGIGRVLDRLQELGIADNTIIFFTSDNGGNMYNEVEGQPPTNNDPLRGTKGCIYEGGTRVPWIVYWPGVTQPGTQSAEIISTVDMYPTMLDMAGIAYPEQQHLDGMSIVPVLKSGSGLDREGVFFHFPHYTPATLNRPSTSVRQGDWKLIRFYGEGPDQTDGFELYNLNDDISETNNLAEAFPQRVQEMNRLIDRHLKDTDAIIPIRNPAYIPRVPGWQPSNDARIDLSNGVMKVVSSGNDPYIYTEDIPIASHFFRIRFRMKSSLSGGGALYWTGGNVKAFSHENRLAFDPNHDGKWHDYQLDFESKNPLNRIRIDPGTSAGTVEIESIILERKWGLQIKEWRF